MPNIHFDPEICRRCETVDCLTRCQYMKIDLETARAERENLLAGRDSFVLRDCVTCYACEEFCPYHNHPFFLLVDRQEQLGFLPAPAPITHQQITMMAMKGRAMPAKVSAPVINMCYFPMFVPNMTGRLFEGATTIVGSDVFCNIMWLHFGRNSVIRERLPRVIDNIWNLYLKDSGVDELVHFHDECYGAYTHLAPAFGIDVPFKSVHMYDFLARRLEALKEHIKPLGYKAAYQRSCSTRLAPESEQFADRVFELIGVTRVERRYDRDTPLCCGAVLRSMQRDDAADDLEKRNLDDMQAAGAQICVFSCPACMFTLGEAVAKRGIMPMLMNDLCRAALGES